MKWNRLALAASAILAGCAGTTTGEVWNGLYPPCPPEAAFPNANCYGGAPAATTPVLLKAGRVHEASDAPLVAPTSGGAMATTGKSQSWAKADCSRNRAGNRQDIGAAHDARHVVAPIRYVTNRKML